MGRLRASYCTKSHTQAKQTSLPPALCAYTTTRKSINHGDSRVFAAATKEKRSQTPRGVWDLQVLPTLVKTRRLEVVIFRSAGASNAAQERVSEIAQLG